VFRRDIEAASSTARALWPFYLGHAELVWPWGEDRRTAPAPAEHSDPLEKTSGLVFDD
jgi:hypothetical protein